MQRKQQVIRKKKYVKNAPRIIRTTEIWIESDDEKAAPSNTKPTGTLEEKLVGMAEVIEKK